jgi:hypothetical protein
MDCESVIDGMRSNNLNVNSWIQITFLWRIGFVPRSRHFPGRLSIWWILDAGLIDYRQEIQSPPRPTQNNKNFVWMNRVGNWLYCVTSTAGIYDRESCEVDWHSLILWLFYDGIDMLQKLVELCYCTSFLSESRKLSSPWPVRPGSLGSVRNEVISRRRDYFEDWTPHNGMLL